MYVCYFEFSRSAFPHSQDKRAGISKKIYVVLYPNFIHTLVQILSIFSLDALSKIVFHTGITSLKLFDVFAKTLCQLMVSENESEQFTFTLLFDKKPPQEGSGEELDNNQGEGIFYRIQFNVNEEFFLTVPISGEKIKVFKKNFKLKLISKPQKKMEN